MHLPPEKVRCGFISLGANLIAIVNFDEPGYQYQSNKLDPNLLDCVIYNTTDDQFFKNTGFSTALVGKGLLTFSDIETNYGKEVLHHLRIAAQIFGDNPHIIQSESQIPSNTMMSRLYFMGFNEGSLDAELTPVAKV